MTEATGFLLLYYASFAGIGAVVGLLIAGVIQYFGN